MRILYLLIISGLMFSACSSNDPKALAQEFCDCVKNSTQSSDNQECLDLAKEHKERLEGDKDQLQKYSDELVNCTNVSK